MANHIGQQFGNFRLQRVLGNGGFATVYLGEHIHLGTQAAIKVLKMDLLHDEGEAFRAEARTIAHLVHPHIIRVFDFGLQENVPFLVMDYAPHGSLRQYLPSSVPLPLSSILPYVEQIADALHYAHQQKIIHRDIKPENLLLGTRNEVLLSDFGLALIDSGSRQRDTAKMAGTIAYMAPEQIRGNPCLASDQYALAIVIYQWLTGTLPFHGSPQQVLLQHLATNPPSLCAKRADLPPAVEAVIYQALAKEPRHRFASIQAFAAALQLAAQGGGQQTVKDEIKTRLSHPPTIIPLRRTPQNVLIGREGEYKILSQLLQETQEQKKQDVSKPEPPNRPYVSLLGDPGIGKTRLAEEASLIAQQQGWAVLWGRAHSHEQHMAYRLWIDILRSALAYDYWPWQEMSEYPERYQPLLALLPELAELFSGIALTPGNMGEQMQFRIWEALQALFTAISIRSPVLIVLDDLHWADSSSCTLLGYLTRNLANQRVLLVGTYREPEISKTHPLRTVLNLFQQQNLMTKLVLGPLTTSQIGQLVDHLPPAIAQNIQLQAAGNPFFAEELARFPSTAEMLPEKKQTLLTSSAQTSTLPSSIVNVFERHITQLSQASQKMLGCAAVLGNAFSLDLIQQMQSSGDVLKDEEILLTQIEEVLQAGLITEESSGAHILYHFWHPLLVDYLYTHLSAARRAHLHRRAAHALQKVKEEQEEVATSIVYHLLNGGSDEPLLIRYAELAGDRAYKLSAFPEVEKYYRLALEHLGALGPTAKQEECLRYASLLECLGECTMVQGKFEEARGFYEQTLEFRRTRLIFSLEEERNHEAQLEALFWCEIGRSWSYLGDSSRAWEAFQRGERTLTDANVVRGPAWAEIRLQEGFSCWRNGNHKEGLNTANEALQLSKHFLEQKTVMVQFPFLTKAQQTLNGNPVTPAKAYLLLGLLENTIGQSADALNQLNAALAIYERHDHQREIAITYSNLADLYLHRSEYLHAKSALLCSNSIFEKIGDIPSLSIGYVNMGILAMRSGNLAGAENWYRQAATLAEQVNDPLYASMFHSYIALSLIDQGKLAEAKYALVQSLKICRPKQLVPSIGFALVVLGHLRFAQASSKESQSKNQPVRHHQTHSGESSAYFLQRAQATLQRALAFEHLEDEIRLDGQLLLAEIALSLGQAENVQQQTFQVLQKARDSEQIWIQARALNLQSCALIALGEKTKASQSFQEAQALFENAGMRLELARALRNYGTTLLKHCSPGKTDYEQGRSYLGQAWEILLECDAKLEAEGVALFLNKRSI